MRFRRFNLLLYLVLVLVLSVVANAAEAGSRSLFQVSTLQALLAGEYDGTVSLKEVLQRGNMGIGTFDKLAGEMIIYDGVIYQGRIDGKAYVKTEAVTTPFVNVARSDCNKPLSTSFAGGYEGLKSLLNRIYPQENKPVLFCIRGKFRKLAYRSVPEQQKPYPLLVEVVKQQAVFKKEFIEGVLIGFRFPEYMSGINVNGFHLHFLSKDKKYGGHLFAVDSGEIIIEATSLNSFEVFLPDNIAQARFDKVDAKKDTEAVEKLEK